MRLLLLFSNKNLLTGLFNMVLLISLPVNQWGQQDAGCSIGADIGRPSTHWGRDKMAAILQTTHSNAFSWIKMLELGLIFHWSLFLMVESTILHHWFRKWLGPDQATSHYLNQWWLDYWLIYASLGLNQVGHLGSRPHLLACCFVSICWWKRSITLFLMHWYM